VKILIAFSTILLLVIAAALDGASSADQRDGFARFCDDGRICLSNNAAERALRGFALGGSRGCSPAPRGADRAAAVTTLIMTARLNDIDPLAWLADVLARIADIPQSRLPELLPWEWKSLSQQKAA